ncbi:hypothetical protein I302_104486 [Kwoniella bestiolae CBS 10118]|uniref:Amidohydrolase-related domain-containing protein n=1 Tax=Kwoniella bestiolae CBS 10118 TaxID=1296100 RepID=A0AAJ8K7P0_9TREE
MSTANITSALGYFELIDQDASQKSSSPYDWEPEHWVQYPVPESYDILARPWIRPEQLPMSFVGVNIVDVENSLILKSMTVKIKAGKIESISKSLKEHMQEPGWESVNAEGLYLSPGLIDVHTHITITPGTPNGQMRPRSDTETALATQYVLKGMLWRGFTTVRDVGGANRHYKNATEQWLIPGPRIFQGGPLMSQSGGHGDDGVDLDKPITGCCSGGVGGDGSSCIVDGVDECTRAARKIMMNGADHIKICSSGGVASPTDKLDSEQFTVAEIKAICDVVRMMKGTLVTAHCFTGPAARNAIEAGIGGIEHGHLLDDDTLKLMAKKGVHLTPTLIVQELLARPPYQAMIPPQSREKLKLVIDGGYKVLKRAHELGVNIAYGTDCFGPMQPNQLAEFELRKKVLPSRDVIKHATVNAAKVLNMQGKIGIIREGAFADLLLLSANPLEDVGIFNDPHKYVKGIVKDGRVVRSELKGLRVEVSLM